MIRKKTLQPLVLFLLIVAIALTLLFWQGERWLRESLLYLSGAPWARRLVTDMPLARQVASRFVAGERVSDALRATRELNASGYRVTLDFLGESVTSATEANLAKNEITHLIEEVAKAKLDASVSVKLTQLGLNIDKTLAYENVKSLLACASRNNNWVRIDMEDSSTIDATLDIYHTLRTKDRQDNVGVVIQSYLFRSEADIKQLCQDGARVRLCKGAYAEPAELAFTDKKDTDENFVALMRQMLSIESLSNGARLAVASHDEKMIDATTEFMAANDLPPQTVEFQMLYGIRRDLQQSLLNAGYPVCIYVPYGQAWYPYFTRRLAERPANLWFFLSNLIAN